MVPGDQAECLVEPGGLPATDHMIARALAEVATVAILSQRTIRHSSNVAEQLQTAFDSRVTIEQAKGVLAHQGRLAMADAFAALRRYARRNNNGSPTVPAPWSTPRRTSTR